MSDAPPPTQAPRPGTGRTPAGERMASGMFALGCLAVLAVAAWMSPSTQGHGTHEQLGLARCTWVALFDKPCPTCGMTTSFAHAAEGSYLAAATTQPLGFLLAMGAATAFWTTAHTAATGSRSAHAAMGMVSGRTLIVVLVLGLGAWAYKLVTWGG